MAAVIALRPQIVLLDEPTAELDPQSSRQIFELLAELNRQGITVIVIEQKVMLLCEYAKHLVVMEHGHVALDGPARDVLSQTERMVELGINCPRRPSPRRARSSKRRCAMSRCSRLPRPRSPPLPSRRLLRPFSSPPSRCSSSRT